MIKLQYKLPTQVAIRAMWMWNNRFSFQRCDGEKMYSHIRVRHSTKLKYIKKIFDVIRCFYGNAEVPIDNARST